MDFDTIIDRIGTHSVKWDMLRPLYGVDPREGTAMWVADMDFRAPEPVRRVVADMAAHGIFGYFGDDGAYLDAIRWWMKTRHGWDVDPDHILTAHGLVNATGICVDTLTAPGDGVLLMTPGYHAFRRVISAAGRRIAECPLKLVDGRYEMDFPAWEKSLRGDERMLILCSPHNPGGRVWTLEELRQTADFCRRHDLILVSDEIHHDLVFPGARHHIMAKAAPDCLDRLIMMTSASKTFNIAGCHTGNIIIPDDALRARVAARIAALAISPSSFGPMMVTAAYSEGGARWLDDLIPYLDANRRLLDEGMAAIPGVRSMPLESTYLAWVDFSGTGLPMEEVIERVQGRARIAANHGDTFGTGGAGFLRFNFAAPRQVIEEAMARLQAAFADVGGSAASA